MSQRRGCRHIMDRARGLMAAGLLALMGLGGVSARAEDAAITPPATPPAATSDAPQPAPQQAAAPTPSAPEPTPAPASPPAAVPASSSAAIGDGMQVKLEYQLHTEDGALVDSTDSRGPFEYTHGRGQIIPGLERQLAGLHVGDNKEIMVRPEEAYGPINPAATEEVDRAQLPQDTQPQVGMVLRGTDPEGNVYRALIKEVKDKSVVLDLNHPLAGKTLSFTVKVVDVHPETATP